FLNGLNYKEATKKVIAELERIGQGKGKTNYRLRDAVFSRQRYWGEPFPVYYVDGMPQMIDAKHLPIKLPEVEKYLPTETGEPPLGNATVWAWDRLKAEVVSNDLIDNVNVFPLELNTMPGWAGSSWYFNRYMDPHSDTDFASQEALNYWKDVELYIGGSEHATGHLLYSRFWQKFLFDKGVVPVDEYAKKLINQGMILGTSAFVYRADLVLQFQDFKWTDEKTESPFKKLHSNRVFISYNVVKHYLNRNEDSDIADENLKDTLIRIITSKMKDEVIDSLNNDGKKLEIKIAKNISPIHADVSFVNASDELNIEAFKNWREDFRDAIFIGEKGEVIEGNNDVYKVGREVEKMSKSKYNVVNPDNICEQYGADSLRLYEMFLGPLEQYKPWNTAGITGVHGFLKKLWRLYHQGENETFYVSDSSPSEGLG